MSAFKELTTTEMEIMEFLWEQREPTSFITVLNLAAVGGIDLASDSDMVTDTMSALGMEVSQAEDQMTKTAYHNYFQ